MTGGTLDLGRLSAMDISPLGTSGGVISKSGSGLCMLTVTSPSGAVAALHATITDGSGQVALVVSDPAGSGLIVSGSGSTYTGGTIVESGTLWVTARGALSTAGGLTVGAGGTFVFDPSLSAGTLSASGGMGVASGLAGSPASLTVVPEPGSIVLLFAAFAALLVLRKSRYDPIHLVWMVKKIGKLAGNANQPRPHPARLDGESGCPAKDRRGNNCRLSLRERCGFRGAKGNCATVIDLPILGREGKPSHSK
jgi:autotransporter-associated beta strand protein